MSRRKRFSQRLLVSMVLALGCSPPRPVEGVWRPGPGEDPEYLPGPMRNFGPFDTYADALKAACPLILSKPNATVGHLKDSNPELAIRTSTEYCAWLYYTPEHQYEMSMLTDLSRPDDALAGRRSCILPTFVKDPRYQRGDLKYIFALHNHPFGSELSSLDLRFIEAKASIHEWEVQTKRDKVRLAIIAFFSKSKDPAAPRCDGFHQYVPATREIMTWTRTQEQWRQTRHGVVVWLDERSYRIKEL